MNWFKRNKPGTIGGLLVVAVMLFFVAIDGCGKAKAQTKEEELGRQLFNDPRLSVNGKVSCATCHKEDKGYTAGALPPALDGGTLALKAPSLWNISKSKHLFWDGRAETLEDQIAGPLTNTREMGNKTTAEAFRRVDIAPKRGIAAIVAYERSLVSAPSRLDEYLEGHDTLSPQEIRGWNLFRGKAECYKCHDPKNSFKDDKFHNTGLGDTEYFYGRASITGDKRDAAAWKTPSLKKCKFTGPYMHDCSLPDLPAVVRFYNEGGMKNANLDRLIKPLGLNKREEEDLVAILKVM